MAAAMIVGAAAFILGAALVYGLRLAREHRLTMEASAREHRLSLDARRRLIEAETDRLRAERLLSPRR